jgi:hypothetical protein
MGVNNVKLLLILAASILALNPRVAIDSSRPLYAISCSTGISIHWRKLFGGGLFGIYSLDSAVGVAAAALGPGLLGNSENESIVKNILLKPCR